MTPAEKKAWENWRRHCDDIQSKTTLTREVSDETPVQKERRIHRLLGDYNAFCEYYFPHYLSKYDPDTGEECGRSHNAPFHTRMAQAMLRNRTYKTVAMWPRGHAKSTHLDIIIPTWLMFQPTPQIHFGLIVGKSYDSAKTLLGDLQAELEFNIRIINDFGEQKNLGSWEDGRFTAKNGTTWMAVGRGQSPRGLRKMQYRPDYVAIDDLDDDELCENEDRVRKLTDWVKSALFGALDVGRGRFVMAGNLISENSVLYNIASTKGVVVSKVKAVDDEGNPVWPDKWTREEAASYRDFVGYAMWEKEMMHNPITQGSIFKNEWIRYKKILPLHKYEDIVCYTDPSWKSGRKNDYKASRVWGKIGNEFHLIDCYVRQDTTGGMVRWLYNFYESLPENVSVRFYMESNLMQDTAMDEFEAEGIARGYQLPIMGDNRAKPDKLLRIEAVAPYWERGWVFYNETLKDSPDMKTGIAQTLALAHGSTAHDDAPDADEGAMYKLQRATRSSNGKISQGGRPRPKHTW